MAQNEAAETEDIGEITGRVLAGIITCGVIAAEADADVKDDEKAALVSIVCGFIEALGGEVDADEAWKITGELAQQVSDNGAENFLSQLRSMLVGDDQRRLGCLVAAAVTMSDEEVSDDETTTYDKLAKALGFDQDEADEIWNEAASDDEDEDE